MLKTEVKRFFFFVAHLYEEYVGKVAHLYKEYVGVEPAQCEGGGDGGDDEDVPHKRAEEQQEQEEHSSNLKEQQQGLFLVYMYNVCTVQYQCCGFGSFLTRSGSRSDEVLFRSVKKTVLK